MADDQYRLGRIAILATELANVIERESDSIPEAYRQSLLEIASVVEHVLQEHLLFIEDRGVLTRELRRKAQKEVQPYQINTLLPGVGRRGYFASLTAPRGMASGIREADIRAAESTPADKTSIDVAVYLDTANPNIVNQAFQAVDDLTSLMGYSAPEDIRIVHGSIFRWSRSRVQDALGSEGVKSRLIKGERALEIVGLDLPQSQADLQWAQAVNQVIASLANIPQACIRVGSLLIVKFQGVSGPVVLTRALSQLEIRALERYPEIQMHPEQILGMLYDATCSLEADFGNGDSNSSPTS